jgi:hypothetical protein
MSKTERAMGNFMVRVGGFYVNESKGLVREITREDDSGRVHWRSYDLRTGSPTGDSLMCSAGRIAQWADREATVDEVARMGRRSAETAEWARAMELAEIVLKTVSDEWLFDEVRRRGHQVI